MEIKNEIRNNISFNLIETKKFKTVQVDIKFIDLLDESKQTYRSLLPYVLYAASKKYPSKALIKNKLDSLYGSNLTVSTTKLGKLSIINFSLKFVNEKYIKESLNKEISEFINEVIFNPLVKDFKFDKDVVDEEIRLLRDEFESVADNKDRFAANRLIEEMFKGENYQISSLGKIEDLDKINESNLYEYYLEFLKNPVEIQVCGTNFGIVDYLKDLNFSKEKNTLNTVDLQNSNRSSVNVIKEYQKNNQAKLCMGYRVDIRLNDKLRYPFVVACSILGGYSHSKLFRIVREKNSLCYSIYSRYDAHKGCMFISAGINDENYDKTVELINSCINDLQNNITEDELTTTINSLINDYLEALDSQSGLSVKAFSMALSNEFDLEYTKDCLKNVTLKDVYEAAKYIKLDTIYFLGCDKNVL